MTKKLFLTGATGFLGKVVLEELIRRKDEFDITKIVVLVREKKGVSAKKRFDYKIKQSACFKHLKPGWEQMIEVIPGDLFEPQLGLSEADYQQLINNTYHIINCAASIDFHLPIQEAARANIHTALNVLAFAKACSNLEKMVHVSTAYVHPFQSVDTVQEERLVRLGRSAREIYDDIMLDEDNEAALLKLYGYPNTYTLTKCISEQLLVENQDNVPLTIVRPSIISPSFQYPFPGWIDSFAAYCGFIVSIGCGYLRALHADRESYLDLVPVDHVVHCILIGTFNMPVTPGKHTIMHAVAGREQDTKVGVALEAIRQYFSVNQIMLPVKKVHTSKRYWIFKWMDLYDNHLLSTMRFIGLLCLGKYELARKYKKAMRKVFYLNYAFPYFTTNRFHFVTNQDAPLLELRNGPYLQVTMQGVYQFLLKKDLEAVVISGKKYKGKKITLREVLFSQSYHFTIRLFAYLLDKMARRCFERITLDKLSLQQAIAKIPPDALKVIIPTHRSYVDFLVCSYIFYHHPDLGIDLPYIAAAEEFSHIPIIGRIFKQCRAFFVKRGQVKRSPSLADQIQSFADDGKTLEFFIEGKRSRSGLMLAPKRGLLRCLQATNKPIAVLPIAISFEKLPEMCALMHEVQGKPKLRMTLSGLLKWCAKLFTGKIQLGRMHLRVGEVQCYNSQSDMEQVSLSITAELAKNLVVTKYHLRCFLDRVQSQRVTLDWLVSILEARGAKVLDSKTKLDKFIHPLQEQWLRNHWIHWFYDDAKQLFPNNFAIQDHILKNQFSTTPDLTSRILPETEAMQALLKHLFQPICEDYIVVLRALRQIDYTFTLRDLYKINPGVYLPFAEQALQSFAKMGLVDMIENKNYKPKADLNTLDQLISQCQFKWHKHMAHNQEDEHITWKE